MMQKLKIIIFFIIILSVIVISLCSVIIKSINNEEIENYEHELMKNIIGDFEEDSLEPQNVSIISDMKTVENCIQNYFIKKNNQELKVITMDMKYIRKANIDKYITYGIIIDSSYKLVNKYYMYVTLDTYNKTYDIEPINIEKYNDNNITINITNIEKNEDNVYENAVIGYQDSIKEYINRYKMLTLTDPSLTYNLLNNSYKEKKFSDINKYQEYVKNNITRIANAEIEKYAINYTDKYLEFVCIDKNGFYYIIRQDVNNCLNYELLLDSYTIEDQKTAERYDKANSQTKIGINIEKIILAINSKDYNYVYDKLDSDFKAKYFDNAENLGAFLQKNLFDLNKISNGKLSNNGNGIYTCNLKLSSYNEENKETKDMTIIMKLLENRDFVMSFSF